MKFNLTVAFIAALSFVTGAVAEKRIPPGSGPDSSVPANILLSIDNSSSMNNSTKRVKAPESMPVDFAVSGDGSWHLAHGASIKAYGRPTRALAKPFRKYNSAGTWLKDYGDGFSLNYAGYPNHPHIPSRIAIDQYDNLYLAHCKTSKIHKFDAKGDHIESFSTPNPLAIDIDSDGNIYVTAIRTKGQEVDCSPGGKEPGPFLWRKLDPSGALLGEWPIAIEPIYRGDPGNGYYPKGLAVYGDSVYIVSDTTNSAYFGRGYEGKISGINDQCKRGYRVRVYNKETGVEKTTWWAVGGTDIEATANGIYILGAEADYAGPAVLDPKTKQYTDPSCGGHVGKYSHSGTLIKRFAPKAPACGPLGGITYPKGMGSDPEGNIYLVGGPLDPNFPKYLKKYDKDGKFITQVAPAKRRGETVKCVLTRLLQNEELNKTINYGLLVWSSPSGGRPGAKMAVGISPGGAEEIVPMMREYCGSDCYTDQTARAGTSLHLGMQLAEDYFENRAGGFTPGPIDPAIPCQRQIIIVISDGMWSDPYKPEAIARRLVENLNVQTLVVGFSLASGGQCDADCVINNYKNLSKEGGSYPFSPLFAQDESKLQATLEFFVQKAQGSNLTYTGTVPTIASNPNAQSGDHIYQSTFTVPKIGQWQGKLTKYGLNADTGSIGEFVWEAGSKLNEKPAESRRIWTVATNVGVASGINNFVVANLDGLKSALYEGRGTSPTDDEARQLIQFIRGVDAYDENIDGNVTEQRHWKLADIYHSEMAIVGPPEKVDSNKAVDTNTEAYYKEKNGFQAFVNANTNRTSVVYVGANDGMLHAFDDTTGEELWAFIPPNMLPNLREMKTLVENTTIPIYGVDGSPVVKDIYYGGQWRSVLMAGLGRDRYGYFALDVTTPETPKFLFAFSNDPDNKVVRHWGPDGSLTKQTYSASGEFNYSKLGEAWSTPTIIAMPNGSARKWVAAIGGGFNSNQHQNTASAVYLIDLANNGKVLKLTDLTDSPEGFINSTPAQLTAVTPDSTDVAKYKGAFLYFTDIEGKLSKINLTNAGQLHGITELLDGEGNLVNQRAATFPVTASSDANGKVWLYFGTGNQDKLQLSLSTIQNRLFGIKDKQFPIFSPAPKSTIRSLKNVTDKGSVCPAEEDLGWYTNLGRDEKSVGKLAIHNGVLFAPNYTPDISQQCYPGTSRLFELDYGCGKPLRSTSLGSGQLTGVRIFKDKMYLGISGTSPRQTDESVKGADGFTKKGNIVVGTPVKGSTGGDPGSVTLHSWREIF